MRDFPRRRHANTIPNTKDPILTTRRLTLRPFADADLPRLADILSNSEIRKTYMIPLFKDRREALTFAEKLQSYSRKDTVFVYGIYLGDTLIGFLNDCEKTEDTIELGYVIAPAYAGNGYATEALSAAIEALFRMGCRCVTAGYFAENLASRRVMEKCGMHSLPREDHILYNGTLHHCFYMAVEG